MNHHDGPNSRTARDRYVRGRSAAVVVLGISLLLGVSPAAGAESATVRVSVSSGGLQGNDASGSPAISADGRFVAFASGASNLVSGDTNGRTDIFVRDRWTGRTRRVSVSSAGVQANGGSSQPAISANGRFVAFSSDASNLVSGDTNRATDIFIRDRWTHTTRRVDVSSMGSQANGEGLNPAISADGRFVAFLSGASNLVTGDSNNVEDIFVRNLAAGLTRRVSISSTGAQANAGSLNVSLSATGRYVAFDSDASNLVSGDTNGRSDVFVRDRSTGTTRRVSISSAGVQANGSSIGPSISADGNLVAFASSASNLVAADTNHVADIFVRNLATGATGRVSVPSGQGNQANSDSFDAAISSDGRTVIFVTDASNLVPGDTNGLWDVFIRDRATATTRRVSVSNGGGQANSLSIEAALSGDGRFVAFASEASNLVTDDTNGVADLFVRGPLR